MMLSCLQAKAKDNTELANTYGQLQRAFDAFDHCVVLLDVTEEGKWRVLYSNAQLQKLTGEQRWRGGSEVGSKECVGGVDC